MSSAAAPAFLVTALLLVLNAGWAYRVVGTHYNLRYTAEQQRNEWAHVDSWIAEQQMHLDGPDAVALRDALQRDAVYNHPTPPQPSGRFAQWFDIDW